jgi:hypothetical protein
VQVLRYHSNPRVFFLQFHLLTVFIVVHFNSHKSHGSCLRYFAPALLFPSPIVNSFDFLLRI